MMYECDILYDYVYTRSIQTGPTELDFGLVDSTYSPSKT